MFYILHGNDVDKSLKRFSALKVALGRKRGDSILLSFSDTDFDESEFFSAVATETLFGSKYIIVCNGLLANKDAAAAITSRMDEVAASKHFFIFREEKPPADFLKKAVGLAFGVEEFAKKIQAGFSGAREHKIKDSRLSGFNIFSLTDAFGARDRRSAWVIFQKSLYAGISADEALWKIIWQIKNILFVKKMSGDDFTRLKLSSFPLAKAKKFEKNFEEKELLSMWAELLERDSASRIGEDSYELAVERFLLSI